MTAFSEASGRTSWMPSDLARFEGVVRRARHFSDLPEMPSRTHPFDTRDIQPELCRLAKPLFDNGHFAQATFEAFKFLDKEIQRHSGSPEIGKKLMMGALGGKSPAIRLNALASQSELAEQEGYTFLFAGAMLAIRNPRGHEVGVADDPDTCLDHLAFASMLLRRLAEAGYK